MYVPQVPHVICLWTAWYHYVDCCCHRNVLVGENQNVKISDFGLSRILAKEDTYYVLSQAKKLPVKWMALESIEYRKFSTYSDSKTVLLRLT